MCRLLDFGSCYWAERMGRDSLGLSCAWGIRYLRCRHDGNAFSGILLQVAVGKEKKEGKAN